MIPAFVRLLHGSGVFTVHLIRTSLDFGEQTGHIPIRCEEGNFEFRVNLHQNPCASASLLESVAEEISFATFALWLNFAACRKRKTTRPSPQACCSWSSCGAATMSEPNGSSPPGRPFGRVRRVFSWPDLSCSRFCVSPACSANFSRLIAESLPPALVARRIEPGGLHRRVLLGAAADGGVARRALYRRVADLGLALGGTAKKKLGERAALRRGIAGGGGRAGLVLAGVEDGTANKSARRIMRTGVEHCSGRTYNHQSRFLAAKISRRRNRRERDVDVRRLAAAVRTD